MPGPGEFAPLFKTEADNNPRFNFGSLGGVWTLLLFFGSLSVQAAKAAHDEVVARRDLFDDTDAYFFGVSVDPADRAERGLANSTPGLRYFWDFDAGVSRAYGVARDGVYAPVAFLLDRHLRVVAVEPAARIGALIERMRQEIAAERPFLADCVAPVLTLPRVFEPELCRALIELYERQGGQRSGFMNEVGGRTIGVMDDKMKRRADAQIENPDLRAAIQQRLSRRLAPAIERYFGWRPTRVERYIVACYSSADNGFFRPHRDNSTPATAHRKFAVTINLNAEAYEGGELRFPEFGARTYKPPTGGATVFGCRMLHEATPVLSGVRYACLPFLYDEEGHRLRMANQHTLVNTPLEGLMEPEERAPAP